MWGDGCRSGLGDILACFHWLLRAVWWAPHSQVREAKIKALWWEEAEPVCSGPQHQPLTQLPFQPEDFLTGGPTFAGISSSHPTGRVGVRPLSDEESLHPCEKAWRPQWPNNPLYTFLRGYPGMDGERQPQWLRALRLQLMCTPKPLSWSHEWGYHWVDSAASTGRQPGLTTCRPGSTTPPRSLQRGPDRSRTEFWEPAATFVGSLPVLIPLKAVCLGTRPRVFGDKTMAGGTCRHQV